jgi:hypothetical protein
VMPSLYLPCHRLKIVLLSVLALWRSAIPK